MNLSSMPDYHLMRLMPMTLGESTRSLPCTTFSSLLAFEKSRKITYLDESITVGYNILESSNHQESIHFQVGQSLVTSLHTRERLLGRIEDRHEAIRLIPLVINNLCAKCNAPAGVAVRLGQWNLV